MAKSFIGISMGLAALIERSMTHDRPGNVTANATVS
jgi:hypothetical protein